MNADFRACERNRQRRPAELTTPIFPSQHLSAFIRVSDGVNIAQPCHVLLTTLTSHIVPTELLALISVHFWLGLLQWAKVLRHFLFDILLIPLRPSVFSSPGLMR